MKLCRRQEKTEQPNEKPKLLLKNILQSVPENHLPESQRQGQNGVENE